MTQMIEDIQMAMEYAILEIIILLVAIPFAIAFVFAISAVIEQTNTQMLEQSSYHYIN